MQASCCLLGLSHTLIAVFGLARARRVSDDRRDAFNFDQELFAGLALVLMVSTVMQWSTPHGKTSAR